MSALVPYNYRGHYSVQTHHGSHKHKKNQYYDQRFIAQQQQQFIPRLYPSLPIYQTPFYQTHGYPTSAHNQFGRSSMSTALISLHQSNEQQRYAQYIHHMDEMQKRYWKQRANTMPVSRNRNSFLAYPRRDRARQYERDRRILPNPAFAIQPIQGFGGSNLRCGNFAHSGYQAIFNNLIANVSGIGNMAPKIRALFIPPGFSPAQQPYSGALPMPPFTFNRMLQPLCSLPLPPSLPQIGSLPLSPLVQQMVIQQYAKPVAILPFSSNYQISEPIVPVCSQISPPPPQQQQQPLISPLSLQQYQFSAQPYTPSLPIPVNMPNIPSNTSPFVYPTDTSSSRPPNSINNYPSTCRACIPSPPSLNIAVGRHNWLQHCSACRHTPSDITKPNLRPNNERSTPLLRQPRVIQKTFNQSTQDQQQQQQDQQQYPHTNASVKMRPWFHKMPALPKGAVIISDQYIVKEDYVKKYDFTPKYVPQHPRVWNSSSRSASLSTNTTNRISTNNTQSDIQSRRRYRDSLSQYRSKSVSLTPLPRSIASDTRRSSYSSRSSSSSSSSSSPSSTCSSCFAAAANKRKRFDLSPPNIRPNLARKQLSATARHINVRYHYQIPDVPAVYHNNRYLKSSDTDSISPTSSGASPNFFQIKEFRQGRPPSPVYLQSIREEEEKASMHTMSTTSFQSRQPVTKTIIIRRFTTDSPSTNSTISINPSLRTVEQDSDADSTTSTMESSETEDQTESITETF